MPPKQNLRLISRKGKGHRSQTSEVDNLSRLTQQDMEREANDKIDVSSKVQTDLSNSKKVVTSETLKLHKTNDDVEHGAIDLPDHEKATKEKLKGIKMKDEKVDNSEYQTTTEEFEHEKLVANKESKKSQKSMRDESKNVDLNPKFSRRELKKEKVVTRRATKQETNQGDSRKRKEDKTDDYNSNGEKLSLDMVFPPSVKQMSNAERNPVAALINLANNTGLSRFSESRHLIDNFSNLQHIENPSDYPAYVDTLRKEIEQNFTEMDLGRIRDQFLHSWNIESKIFACANCGIKEIEMGGVSSHEVSIEKLSVVVFKNEEVSDLENIPEQYRSVISFYKSSLTGRYYHLHPEFVKIKNNKKKDMEECATVCSSCYDSIIKRGKLPVHSLSMGIDFGNTDRLLLPKLTIAEEYVLSFSRLYVTIVKLFGYNQENRQSGKLGHTIVFPQYGPELEKEIDRSRVRNDRGTYPRLECVERFISIAFIGSHLQWEALVADKNHQAFKSVQVRADVIYLWLTTLKVVNPRYKDIIIDDSSKMTARIQNVSLNLIQNATILSEEDEINIDRVVTKECEEKDYLNYGESLDESLPMSLLTKSGHSNVTTQSATEIAIKGVADTLLGTFHNTDPEMKCEESHSLNTSSNTVEDDNHQFQEDSTRCVEIKPLDEALNEFEQNDYLIYSAFPHLFPIGKGLRKTGSLPEKDVIHIEYQWHGKFASCKRFLFLLFDQFQRHSASRIVKTSVLSNQTSLKSFCELVADPSFLNQLKNARDNPNTSQAKNLLGKLTPHISMVNRKIPYTPAARKSALGKLLNMVRFFGLPSVFFTFALDDIYGLLSIRLILPMIDNFSFPATEDGFAESLRNCKTEFRNLSVDSSTLKKLLSEGPVFAAKMFYMATNAIFTHLFGTPPDGSMKKKTIPLPERKNGIFGVPIASFGTTEEQTRGSLHMHTPFWGGLTPSLLQASGGIPSLTNLVAECLDKIVMAHIQPLVHVKHLLRDINPDCKPPHAALFKPHHPIYNKQEFSEDFQRTVDLCNIHQHTQTCCKSRIGKTCCRLGRPVKLQQQTGCEEIVSVQDSDYDKNQELSFTVLEKIQPPSENITLRRHYSTIPVATRDKRMIMYHLKRPIISQLQDLTINLPIFVQEQLNTLTVEEKEKLSKELTYRNGSVVEFNPLASASLGCNTNASILGSDPQCKSALCYIIKYITKSPAELAHTLSLLHHARKAIELNPSKAKDSGTPIRTGIHYLNKIVNDLSGAIEISAPMAAAAILGMPAETTSESFWIAYVSAAVNYVLQHPEYHKASELDEFADINTEKDNDQPVSNDESFEEEIIDESDFKDVGASQQVLNTKVEEGALQDFFAEKEPIILQSNDSEELKKKTIDDREEAVSSTATIYKTGKKIVAVPQHIHYAYRSNDLSILSLYEYVSLIDVVVKPDKKTTGDKRCNSEEHHGRESNRIIHFDKSHPLYDTHVQRLRSKTKVPILVGPPPIPPAPKPKELTNEWKEQARKFSNYFLILYRPWLFKAVDGSSLPEVCNWHELGVYMKTLEHGNPSLLNTVRARWIKNSAHGLRITSSERTAASKYRFQCATSWTKSDETKINEKQHGSADSGLQLASKIEETKAAEEALENITILRNAAGVDDLLERSDHSSLEYYQATKFVLTKIFENPKLKSCSTYVSKEGAKNILGFQSETKNLIELLQKLKEDLINQENIQDPKDNVQISYPSQSCTTRSEKLQHISSQMDCEQREICNLITAYFQSLENYKNGRGTIPDSPLLLLHGGPGTGKSFLAKRISEVADVFSFSIGCVAPTGIAASNLPNGRTAHNFFGIPMFHDTKTYLPKPDTLKLVILQKQAKQSSLALILIDEISNMGAEMFSQIEKRCRQIMNIDVLFGGLSVIVMGDFCQIPPVLPAVSLHSSLMKEVNKNKTFVRNSSYINPSTHGALIFSKFKKIELKQQMRISNDPSHVQFLSDLRLFSKNQKRRSTDALKHFKTLTKEDVEKDNSWTIAPIIVTSNEERWRINQQQSKVFAKNNNTPRFVWFQKIHGLIASGINQSQIDYLYATCPPLKGIFVAGAPGFLLHNISPTRGLTNGTSITFHSIILDPKEDRKRIIKQIMQEKNDDIILEYIPKYILVKLVNADKEKFKGIFSFGEDIVIPLEPEYFSKPFLANFPITETDTMKHRFQAITHGVELGFSITLHKIQGQTCTRLIVDLNRRPFQPQITYSGFYVAVSRVRKSEDLRIMPIQPKDRNLNYLATLQPPSDLMEWLNSYDENGYFEPSRINRNDEKKGPTEKKEKVKKKREDSPKEFTNPSKKSRK